MTMCRFIEEPCVVKVTRTDLKTSGTGDSLAEFNMLGNQLWGSRPGVVLPAPCPGASIQLIDIKPEVVKKSDRLIPP